METLLAQAGSRWDERTGAVVMPIYQTATFRHAALGHSTGFDYSRSGNPTRKALEDALAGLEGGVRGFAFASGLAAIDAVLGLFEPGARLVVTEDLYGGTFRLLERVYRARGLEVAYLDTSDEAAWQRPMAARVVRFLLVQGETAVPEDALFEAPEPVKRAIEVALRQLPEGGAALEQAFLTVCRKLMLRRIDEQLGYIEKSTKQAPGAYDLTEETRRLLAQRIELLALKKRVQEELRPSPAGTKAPLQPV